MTELFNEELLSKVVMAPKHHWKECHQCKGKGGIKWQGFKEPLCESCLIHMFDQEIATRGQ